MSRRSPFSSFLRSFAIPFRGLRATHRKRHSSIHRYRCQRSSLKNGNPRRFASRTTKRSNDRNRSPNARFREQYLRHEIRDKTRREIHFSSRIATMFRALTTRRDESASPRRYTPENVEIVTVRRGRNCGAERAIFTRTPPEESEIPGQRAE